MPLTSTNAIEQSLAQHNDDPFRLLLTLTHPLLAEPVYVVRSNQRLLSRGNIYLGFPFWCEEPSDGDQAPEARITIANVDRAIGQKLESLVTAPKAKFELVLQSTPDTVERTWDQFSLVQARYDAMQVTGTLRHISYWRESWPNKWVRPNLYPGLVP